MIEFAKSVEADPVAGGSDLIDAVLVHGICRAPLTIRSMERPVNDSLPGRRRSGRVRPGRSRSSPPPGTATVFATSCRRLSAGFCRQDGCHQAWVWLTRGSAGTTAGYPTIPGAGHRSTLTCCVSASAFHHSVALCYGMRRCSCSRTPTGQSRRVRRDEQNPEMQRFRKNFRRLPRHLKWHWPC